MAIPNLLVFLSLVVAFGLLTANQPPLWEAFLPILLLGLSYAVSTLSLHSLFREDWEDGTLEWLISEGSSLETYTFGKIFTHWMCIGIPLTALVGLISGFSCLPLIFGVAVTSLTVVFLGAIGSALCLTTSSQNVILLPLLILPLGIPMMLVSMGSIMDATANMASYVYLQIGLFLIAGALSLIACPFALRLSLR